MKIAIDTSPLKTGHGARGTGSYTRLLIEALQRFEPHHSYYFFTRGQMVPKNADIVHYPYFDPFFLTLPLRKPILTVVTVHDLIPIAFAEHFPRGIRGEIKWQIQRYSLSGASAIITDSNASKKDILNSIAISEKKVRRIYLAPSDIFKPMKNSKALNKIKEKFHLPDRFVLYVGDVNWNKNIIGLIKAVSQLPDLPLVLVGKAFLDKELTEVKRINYLISELPNVVMKLGFIDEKDLVVLYNLASVYVQPSFAEGFGLPVLEAMACGCPVVSSTATSLKEIAGLSIMVNPGSPQEIAHGITKGLSLNRDAWQRDAFEWLKKFSWKRTANETMSVYKSIIGS